MARAIREGFPLPSPKGLDPFALRAWAVDLTKLLGTYLREIAQGVNDDLLVRTDWIRSVDEDYAAKPSDRVILVFPSANRAIAIPTPEEMVEPHPLSIRHAGSSNTVTIDAGTSTLDGSGTVALAAGESRVIVPLRQKIVDETGVGTVGWYTASKTP